ncbi:hypothetical protein RhiirA4_465688 [Rhizophagus irregularis]|uniref:Reverse transcriptase domain-containing protein n=1 Tax=Rhizophagus irregularis TaxID=588596 RepID=A0A2I1GSL1_9GLOM|nr:hypothetical protein RhiirA4_465688 [Rhizophagus irregularis]
MFYIHVNRPLYEIGSLVTGGGRRRCTFGFWIKLVPKSILSRPALLDIGVFKETKYNHIYHLNSLLSILKEGITLISLESSKFEAKYHIDAIVLAIKTLLLHINNLLKKEKSQWDLKQIEHFVNRRNVDIVTNQKRALDSEQMYTIDPTRINQLTNDHYQNIGSSYTSTNKYNEFSSLREPWFTIYQPKTNISHSAINLLTAQITIEELNATLKTLPNNKAPEPSGIVYELIRKLPSSFHKKLTVFYNYILDNGIIPSSWQDALLHPIPKPAWWDNNIQHTRPIVLLDIFRKVLVKIINARLNKYLSENNILQSNNLAGTQARLILYRDYLRSTNCHYRGYPFKKRPLHI